MTIARLTFTQHPRDAVRCNHFVAESESCEMIRRDLRNKKNEKESERRD